MTLYGPPTYCSVGHFAEQDVWAPPFGRRRLGAAVWAPAFGRRRLGARPFGRRTFGRRPLCERKYTIIISSIPFKLSDENDACFTAIEAGRTDLKVDTYFLTKITRVSLQSKLDELLSFFYTYSSMKITPFLLQSKLDELI